MYFIPALAASDAQASASNLLARNLRASLAYWLAGIRSLNITHSPRPCRAYSPQ